MFDAQPSSGKLCFPTSQVAAAAMLNMAVQLTVVPLLSPLCIFLLLLLLSTIQVVLAQAEDHPKNPCLSPCGQ